MKLSKLLIKSSLVVAPIAAICPTLLTSCSKTFEAEVIGTHYLYGSEMFFHIPLAFSYSPTHEVIVRLIPIEGTDLSGLTLKNPRFVIKKNQATLDLEVAETLWTNKKFCFDIQITYDDMQMPFVLKDFTLIYIFDQPEMYDKIKLVSEKNIVLSAEETSYYTIQLERLPVGNKVSTSLTNIISSDPKYMVATSSDVTVIDEPGRVYIQFPIMINGSIPTSLNYWASFNLHLSFINSKGVNQENVIYGCSLTHPAQ